MRQIYPRNCKFCCYSLATVIHVPTTHSTQYKLERLVGTDRDKHCKAIAGELVKIYQLNLSTSTCAAYVL